MKKIIFTFFIVVFVSFICTAQTVSDTLLIKKHLTNITKTDMYRNFQNVEQLNEIANYISDHFKQYSESVKFQEYKVDKETYKNVICSFGEANEKTIVIGAHYDVCGNQEGADDNASGVVGLLELARLLGKNEDQLNYRIELVGYTLEEPPFFRTENMGSYIHAKSLIDEKKAIYGMVSLEMIGYFDNTENSQSYPVAGLSSVYGTKGDFISLVNKFEKGEFAEKFNAEFQNRKSIKTEIFDSPIPLPGVDLSDHLNYWNFGFSALMITDTAFLRNRNYHTKGDTIEKLDITRMAKVIDTVFDTLLHLK